MPYRKPTLSRRRVLAGAAGLFAGGGAYALVGITPAAAVTADLTIPDETYSATDAEEIYTPVIEVSIDWSYSSVENAAQVMLAVLVDDDLAESTIMSNVAAPDDSGTDSLIAPAVASRQHDSQDWQPANNASVSQAISVTIMMEVRDTDGNTLVADEVTTDTTITVEDTGQAYTASLGGTGDIGYRMTENGEVLDGTTTQ